MSRMTLAAFSLFLVSPGLLAAEGPAVVVDDSARAFAAMSVADLPASVAWYRGVFGLKQVMEYKAEDGDLGIVVLSRPGLTVELQQHRVAKPAAVAKDQRFLQHGIFKFGVVVTGLKASIETLRGTGNGIVIEPFLDKSLCQWSAIIEDSDGNRVQLFEPLPPSDPACK